MPTSSYNIDIDKGNAAETVLVLKTSDGVPQDLSNYTSGYAPIREKYGETGIFGEFFVDIQQPPSGVVVLSMTQENSELLPVSQGRYELFLIDASGRREEYLQGFVNVYPSLY